MRTRALGPAGLTALTLAVLVLAATLAAPAFATLGVASAQPATSTTAATAPSAIAATASAAPAGKALTDITLTLSQTSGGALTRFTFIAKTAAPVSSASLTFPEGFDLSEVTIDAVTLEGLTRIPVTVTEDISGTTVKMSFDPTINADSTLRVQVYDVRLPNEGGEYKARVDYESAGVTGSTETPPFEFVTVTRSERLSRWLDSQGWVEKWNSVRFLNMFFQPQRIAIAVPLLFRGFLMSVGLVGVAFPIAIIGGLALAFLKMAKLWPVRMVANAYINVIRGTPLFLQIYIAFVGLPILGVRAPLFITGVIVLALNSSAYLAEIFRAGIQSIHKGQFEAASSLGMTYPQSMAFVIIPQTVKRVLPTMTSEFILLFKDTALLSAVGMFELMLYSNSLATRSGNLTPFMVAAGYYLLVTIPLIKWVANLERKLAIAEGGQITDETSSGRAFFGRLLGRGGEPRPVVPAAETGSATERR